ncbi:phosphotriesterase [Chloroflexota bacterium]
MAMINSVLGPLNTADLGFTLMHEHLLIGVPPGITQNYPELLGDHFIERIVSQLDAAKQGGINTIIDATTFDMGRDVSVMVESSRRSGINVIACTGWFYNPPRLTGNLAIDQYAQLFVREIQEGIAGTGVKAGILKSAADFGGVTSGGEAILRAVARAHLKTNTPIMLHSYAPEQVGKQQLAILREEGVDMKRVKVDHSLETTDVEYLTWLLEQGCYLGMERCPWINVSVQSRVKTIKALIDAGWAHRLLPSHDYLAVKYNLELSPSLLEFIEKSNPYGFLYLNKVAVPMLRDMGVPEATITSLFVDNPRHFFE